MKGKKKVIEGTFPVTVASAVYLDNTSKTLKEAIDNNEFGGGTTVSINGRGCVNFLLRGGKIFADYKIENSISNTTIKYSFPTGDTNRLRRLFVRLSNGQGATIDLQDGELSSHEALVYNASSNSVEVRYGTWGNIACSINEYVLLYNCVGFLSGELVKYVDFRYNQDSIKIKPVTVEQINTKGSTQGIMILDNNIYTSYHATDEHVSMDGKLGDKVHNIGHMNAMDYNPIKDCLITANGSKSYTLAMKGWIFLNWDNTFNSNDTLDINTLEKVELDFSQFEGEYKAQLCWGDYNSDIVYLLTSDNRVIRELQLNKTNNIYDGTYTVLNTYYTNTTGIVGGFIYHKGCLYTGIKGDIGVRKMTLCSDNGIYNEYIKITGKVGDVQGIAIQDDSMIVYTDSKGYKLSLSEIE